MAWHPDRLHRSPVELEEFIAVCEGRELDVVTVQAGQIDLSTPSGRMVARMLGSAARYESEHKAERQRRKALELARAGKVSGGGTRAYGFEKDFMTIRPDEAAIIRVITERFLAGESLGSLVSWLNANEVPTSGGGSAWRLFTLRRLLRSARISGQREHRGEILGPGEWEQIITPQQTARIRAILDDPARKNRRSPRRYLLASMLRCGKCGATLASRPRDDGQRRYVCTKGIDYHGCGSLYVPAEPLEDLIARAVLIRLDSPEMAAALTGEPLSDDARWEQEAAAAQAELEELAELKGRRVISTAEWIAARRPIVERLETGRKQLTAANGADTARRLAGQGGTLSREWAVLPLSRQQAIIRLVLDHAVIGPGRRGLNRFDPSRVRPVWRL